jgi:hypothetical protein
MMTPKEKAKELVDKYSIKVEVFFTEDSIPRIVNAQLRLQSAKQCALIAVDEIMLNEKINHSSLDKTYEYLEEVKKEIELL